MSDYSERGADNHTEAVMKRETRTWMFKRIGLWFSSLFLSVALFSLLWGAPAFFFVLRITMLFALPVAFLYLPFVIGLKDAEEGRIGTILGTGILIGPASLVLWGLILQLRGANAATIWHGDGIGLGVDQSLILALIVGFLTTAFYVIALKVTRRRSAP